MKKMNLCYVLTYNYFFQLNGRKKQSNFTTPMLGPGDNLFFRSTSSFDPRKPETENGRGLYKFGRSQ